MPPTNDFLPFCETDTGTNLLSQSDYIADAQRPIGNQPGVARSKLQNKATRQSAYVTAELAQFVSDTLNDDVLDDALPAKLLSQLKASLSYLSPVVTHMLSGSGTYHLPYVFFIASGNASSGATYSNNSFTFTVTSTIAGGTVLHATGTGDPTVHGTLTKTGGSGDGTLTFYSFRKPVFLDVEMVGAGGGGGGGGVNGSIGTIGVTGGDTTFGTTLLTAGGGGGGAQGDGSAKSGPGGVATIVGLTGIAVNGGIGGGSCSAIIADAAPLSGDGASSAFGGAPGGVTAAEDGQDAANNSGSGGGGGGSQGSGNGFFGGGGSSGAYIKCMIPSPSATYTWTVGVGGAGGAPGGTGHVGGVGGDGQILVIAKF